MAATLLSRPSGAVGTRTFDLDSQDEFTGGDSRGVAVGSDGVVRAGLNLGNVPVGNDVTSVFAAVTLGDGSVLLGTAPNGKIIRVAGDQATVFADTKEMAVTALAVDAKGTVYAATIPDGKIFKVSQGKAEPFATLPDATNVWALAFDKAKTTLYAAGGGPETKPEGRVWRVTTAGQVDVLFKCEEPQLVSVAVASNGEVFAGSSGKGLLYRITGPGRATVMYDFVGEEVKNVVVTDAGVVWAIVNEYGEAPDPPRRSGGRSPGAPSSTARPKPGKGSLVRFDAQGRPERMMRHEDTHYMTLALDDAGQPYVGTGAEGRVYTVDDTHAVTLVADTDERQITAIAVPGFPKNAARPTGAYVVGSDGAVFHRILGKGGADAVWTSKVLDAGLRARFGTLSFRATGALELSTRTGNTQVPDGTWSAWSNGMTANGTIQSPAGRFIQVRARWANAPDASLEEVILPFLTDNLRPVVTEVDAVAKSGPRESKEGLVSSGGDVPKHDATVKVTWRVDNPDADALRYRIWYRKEDQTAWHEMLKPEETLTKTEFDWDTSGLPEGKYRVRVEASDEAANPPDQVQKHQLETGGVLVDNTPPTIGPIAITGRKLKVRVVDGASTITRIEVSYDGKADFRPLAPTDGIFDAVDESVDAEIGALVPTGSHIVAVRAYDAAGNVAVKDVEAK
jgi:sugar lactone lactonase YvrE